MESVPGSLSQSLQVLERERETFSPEVRLLPKRSCSQTHEPVHGFKLSNMARDLLS